MTKPDPKKNIFSFRNRRATQDQPNKRGSRDASLSVPLEAEENKDELFNDAKKIEQTSQRLYEFLNVRKVEIKLSEGGFSGKILNIFQNNDLNYWRSNGIIPEVFLNASKDDWEFYRVARENSNKGSTVMCLQGTFQSPEIKGWYCDKDTIQHLIAIKQAENITFREREKTIVACKIYDMVATIIADDQTDTETANYLKEQLRFFTSSVNIFSNYNLIKSRIIGYLEDKIPATELAVFLNESKKQVDSQQKTNIEIASEKINNLNNQLKEAVELFEISKKPDSPKSEEFQKLNQLSQNIHNGNMKDYFSEILEIFPDLKSFIIPDGTIGGYELRERIIIDKNNPVKIKIFEYLRNNLDVEKNMLRIGRHQNDQFTIATAAETFLNTMLIENYDNEQQSSVLYNSQKIKEIEEAMGSYIDKLSRVMNPEYKNPYFSSFKFHMDEIQNSVIEEKKEQVVTIRIAGEDFDNRNEARKPSPTPSKAGSRSLSEKDFYPFR